jgi:tRNA(Ile2) C34 agmatinyltransferase TiaS
LTATLTEPLPLPSAPPQASLEDLVLRTWTAVAAGEQVACPVCSGAMQPRWSAGAGVVGGRCGDCGTTLE